MHAHLLILWSWFGVYESIVQTGPPLNNLSELYIMLVLNFLLAVSKQWMLGGSKAARRAVGLGIPS